MINLSSVEFFDLLKIDLAGMIPGSFREVMIKSGLWALEAALRQIAFLSRKCWRSNQEGVNQLPQR